MMPLKESLAATGFDPAWLEQVVAKFGEDLLPLLEALVAAGFAPAWLATYVEMLGPIFLKLAVAWIAKRRTFAAGPAVADDKRHLEAFRREAEDILAESCQ
jgi:hypothetical protein